jgi:hypothetical protein
MKSNNVNGFDKRKVSAHRQCDQVIESFKAGDAKSQFTMRMIWLILGVACAALGWVLLTILLK